jgi:hypothetical protein
VRPIVFDKMACAFLTTEGTELKARVFK